MISGLLTYAAEAVLCSGMLYLLSRFVIKRNTGHNLSRTCLVGSLVISAVIPALSIPVYPAEVVVIPDLPAILSAVDPAGTAAVPDPGENLPAVILLSVYSMVACVLLIRLILQTAGIRRYGEGAGIEYTRNYRIIESGRVQSPFSFFRNIFIPPGLKADDRERIIVHESSHIRHRHSLELLFVEIFKCLFWFNPFTWLTQKSLIEVHEYQADSEVIGMGYDVKEYQSLIFRQLFGCNPDIASGLSSPVIKKRFIMMNTDKAKTGKGPALLKGLAMIPVVAVLLTLFSFTRQETVYTGGYEPGYAADGKDTAAIHVIGYGAIPKTMHVPVNDPLILVDGKVLEGGLTDISPESIESISVTREGSYLESLKEIYGDKADNGIISITTKENAQKKEEVFLVVEEMPKFNGGGLEEFRKWLVHEFKYPADAQERGVQGLVVASFIIDKTGTVTDIQILQSPDASLSMEMISVIGRSPKWEPGKQRGENVNVKCTLPVQFSFNQ